jgi:hypothetical protein
MQVRLCQTIHVNAHSPLFNLIHGVRKAKARGLLIFEIDQSTLKLLACDMARYGYGYRDCNRNQDQDQDGEPGESSNAHA